MTETPRRPVRVGLIKSVPVKWDLAANWRTFEELLARAAGRGAQIVCTPECYLDGYVAPDESGWPEPGFRQVAQALDGEYITAARRLAERHGVYLVFGFTERAAAGCYNSAALIGPGGDLLGCYHKTHLLDHDTRYLPGQDLPVWQTPLGCLGIMICADRRWPETARTLRLRGAELILNPTYGMWHLDNEWWMRTRSYENECFICFAHPNVSLVTSPKGELAAKLQSNLPDVLVHDVDLGECLNRMLPHRRPDIYAL
ncbi:MAG: carbon-nitrogen hydrolase family protein [Chloroflexi bacterium]|nr:carbon-nitrogen hydrolase family protein [Chloroflexota bacterium]